MATPSAFAEGSLEIVQFSLYDIQTGGFAGPSPAPGASAPVHLFAPKRCAYITVKYNSTSLWRFLKASDFSASFADGRVKKGETLTVGGKSDPANFKIRNDELLKCYVCFGTSKQDIIDIVAE